MITFSYKLLFSFQCLVKFMICPFLLEVSSIFCWIFSSLTVVFDGSWLSLYTHSFCLVDTFCLFTWSFIFKRVSCASLSVGENGEGYEVIWWVGLLLYFVPQVLASYSTARTSSQSVLQEIACMHCTQCIAKRLKGWKYEQWYCTREKETGRQRNKTKRSLPSRVDLCPEELR